MLESFLLEIGETFCECFTRLLITLLSVEFSFDSYLKLLGVSEIVLTGCFKFLD